MNPSSLRLKPYLSPTEIGTLCEYAVNLVKEKGVQLPFDSQLFMKYCSYAIMHEVGGHARDGGMPTGLGNSLGYAGLLQTGVDLLIEGNSKTKDNVFKRRRPCMWAVFKSGIHEMYTRRNKKLALDYHISLHSFPRNIEGTVSDSLVSIVNFLDTCLWAFKILRQSHNRHPSMQEVYAFHLHGYMLMSDYFLLKSGLKPLNKKNNLDVVTSKIRAQLKNQSAAVRVALSSIGVS